MRTFHKGGHCSFAFVDLNFFNMYFSLSMFYYRWIALISRTNVIYVISYSVLHEMAF